MEIQYHFSSPIWLYQKPDFIKSCIKHTDKYIAQARKINSKLIKQTNDFGLSHHSTGLLADHSFQDLKYYIGTTAWRFLDAQGYDLKVYKLFMSELWVQEFSLNGGGHQQEHVHPNDHVSGFYFLKCGPDTSYPIFNDPRNGASTTKLKRKEETVLGLGSEQITFRPIPGTIMLFNSFLPHQFAVDPGKKPFRFIHFNVRAVNEEMAKHAL